MKIGNRKIVLLREMSPSDFRFQKWRTWSSLVADLYKGTIYDEYAKGINHCGRYLKFKKVEEADELGTLQIRLILEAANFCRIRFCLFCQWRKSLVWHGKLLKGMPKIMEMYPEHRWLALTLGIRNCDARVLRREIRKMNEALRKLLGLGSGGLRSRGIGKYFYPIVEGYICTTEVTRGEDNSCHPHFHILLLVKPEYFDKEAELYIPQQSSAEYNNPGIVELWQKALGVSYRPTAYIQAVKINDVKRQVCEALKYNTKPSSIWYDSKVDADGCYINRKGFEETQNWLVEVTGQVYRSRFVKTGGCVKELLRDLEKEPSDLIHVDDEERDLANRKGQSVIFGWIGRKWEGYDISCYALVDEEGELIIQEQDLEEIENGEEDRALSM